MNNKELFFTVSAELSNDIQKRYSDSILGEYWELYIPGIDLWLVCTQCPVTKKWYLQENADDAAGTILDLGVFSRMKSAYNKAVRIIRERAQISR